jgi:dolichol-phosphate mannosyltransferase
MASQPEMMPDTEAPLVSVIVPTLNEADNIDPLLTRLTQAMSRSGNAFEIVIADGGSSDDTRLRTEAWAMRAPVRFVAANSGHGISGDVLVAAQASRGDVVVVMDADLSHPPEKVPELVQPVLDGSHDMVVGSRYIPGGGTPDWPWSRRLMSRGAGAIAWPFVSVADPTSGFFAVRRQPLLDVDPKAEGFKIALEVMLGRHSDLRITEVAISFRDRTRGHSKMSLGQVSAYLRRLSALLGGLVSTSTITQFALVGLLGMVVDLGGFELLRHAGANLSTAHVSSFVLATIVNYILNSRWVFRETNAQGIALGGYVRFLAVCLLALFLRGGVLAILSQGVGMPELGALVAAIVAAAMVNYLGFAFFVFPNRDQQNIRIRWSVAVVGIVGYTLLLRLVYLGLPDLLPEEAYYWNYAQHPSLGYLDHPPMVAWLITMGTSLFGDTEFGVRAGSFLCWCVSAVFSFCFARNLYDKETALRSVMFVAVFPAFFAFGFFALPDAPLVASWSGALYFLERALLAEKRWAWWGLGVCIGVGMLSKYTIALLGLATLVFILIDKKSLSWLRRPEPYIAVVLAAVLFLPVVIWNYENDWASFGFQTVRRVSSPASFSLQLLVGAILLMITPVGALSAFQAVFTRSGSGFQSAFMDYASRRRLFTLCYTLAPLLVFVVFSLRHPPNINWTGPLWLAIIPVVARRLTPVPGAEQNWKPAWGQKLWAPMLVIVLLGYGAVFHYLAIGLPGVPYRKDKVDPVAWEQLGLDVRTIESEIEDQTGQKPLVVGMDKYNLASELAFYRRQEGEDTAGAVANTASRHLFGNDGLMYEIWSPPEKYQNRSLILVSFDPQMLSDDTIKGWVEHYGGIIERPVEKLDVPAGRYYYRIAKRYRGGKTATPLR